ncbi:MULTISPECIES: calcium/sodium antiporter [unclassified Saccharicrinis]|uniref:calcium/sodium antiporter n=1 Tax=unclassified Saccharicrinis TaxID=2646859 RepID=UPI003D349CC8
MIISILLLVVGFGLLIKGADFLVNGSSSLAKRFNVSELVIGLTIVAFGTSAPELVVNTIASVNGYDDVVMGNIIGSNIFNLLFILGVSGIIYPITVQVSTIWKEIPYSLAAAIILIALANDALLLKSTANTINQTDGIILLVFFCLFMVYIFFSAKKETNADITQTKQLSLTKTVIYIILGLTGLVLGGRFVVNNAIQIARMLSVSEKLIGLTIVSIGTSLPELATSVVAAIKKKSDLAIGNVIGSNIFNIFLILGISSIISPIDYSAAFNFDIGILIFSKVFLFIAMFTGVRKKLDRWEAGVLLLIFLGYLAFLIIKK